MERNVGRIDAAGRWILAAVFFAISLILNPFPGIALGAAIAALVMVATALTRVCPVYRMLGVNTCPRDPAARGT